MVEDFIKSVGLKAKIVLLPKGVIFIRCRLFAAGETQILAISLKSSTLDFAKIENAAGEKVKPVDEEETFEITGYRKEFLPPVSIYGVKVLIDPKVMLNETVYCMVNESQAIEIGSGEIKDFNDDAEVVDIIK